MITAAYTRAHAAFATAAREHALRPFDVRILLAVHERDDSADTAAIATDLGQPEGATVRRALPELVMFDLVTTVASDGGRVRPGTRTVVTLTAAGRAIAERALLLAQPPAVTVALDELRREYEAA